MLVGDGDGDVDDDDFQNPRHAVAFSQSIILSSLKSSLTQPLKLSNGCLSRKRSMPSTAIGKENESKDNKQSSISRGFNNAQEKIPVIRKSKKLDHKISPHGLSNRSITIGCSADDGIEDLKTILSAPNAPNLGENRPYFERTTGNGSQYLVSTESSLLKSVTSGSSNYDQDCSDVCADKVELDSRTRSSCYLKKPMDLYVAESADEDNDYNEIQSERIYLASTELRLPEDCLKKKTEIHILNHSVYQGMMENEGDISSEARVLELKKKSVSCECQNYSSGRDVCNKLMLSRAFKESNVLENGPIGGMQFLRNSGCESDIVLMDEGKHNNYAMSIEAKLLDPSEKLFPCTRGGHVEVGVHDEFKPGTQLNMLMDLCCEMGDQTCIGNGMNSFELTNLDVGLNAVETNLLVDCPLCRTDITKLSEEMRHVHTNECLDKDNNKEELVPISEEKLNACQQHVDTNPVLEWLRALDLCRYEEVFTREEIDWDTLQSLTEEDLINMGVVALGPRKKIVRALKELCQRNSLVPDGESDTSNVAANERKKAIFPGNKLITEYFYGPMAYKMGGSIPLKLSHNVLKASINPTQRRVNSRRGANCGRLRDIPPWCCISGTPFRVDAFRYLRGDCSHWFLTHFHMDHYQGLTKNFCHGKIYCSKITANLVNMKIGVPWDRIQILPLNEKIIIAGVNLTCLDANHCPGSIIIIFEPPNNKAILHTGDFRFSSEMASSPLLQSSHIHTLILDTTYCNPQYNFPKQDEVVQFVIDAIQAEAFNAKTLFLIGTYTIGKEKLFLEAARTLKKKVYVGAGKFNLLKCLNLPEGDMQLFTENEMESHIHLVPIWSIASFKRMKHITEQYMGRYNLIVAFSPTGWTFGKGKKKKTGRRWQQGTVIRYEVPYSEHCSFTELKDFVRFISPEIIIPSVNNKGPESVDAMLALLVSDS